MNTTDHYLEPEEGLQLIADVISRTREDMKGYSFLYLVWGWIISLASLLFFVLHTYTTSPLYFLPFPVLVSVGIVITVARHAAQRRATQTYIAFFLKNLWIVLGIGFIATIFVSLSLRSQPFSYTLLIGGIGTLVSGLSLRFRPLVAGGLLFFAFALASVFVSPDYRALLQAVAVIAGYLVPGYLLKHAKAKRATDL